MQRACGETQSRYQPITKWESSALFFPGELLLQPIHGVHHALKLRPIQQIERALFPRKHLKRHASRSRHHPGRFLRRKIACRNRFDRQLNEDSQPADTPGLVVDLVLGRAGNIFVFRRSPP